MNRVILMGRLTRDPEVRYSNGERSMAIARYTLAVDRRGRRSQGNDQQQTADFIPCVAFDRAGEFAERYFRQGMRVLVSGRIQTGSYTNRDGQKVYTTEVIVDDQEFADSKGAGASGANSSYGSQGGGYNSGNSGYNGGGSYGGQNNGGSYGGNGGYAGEEKPAPQNASAEGFMNIPDGVEDEGLPFN